MIQVRRLRGSPRRLAATIGCLALVVAGAACSSGGSGGSGGSGTINLTYAMWQTPEQAGYQKSIDVFEKAHPNIHVTIESFAYNNYQPKLTTEFSSGGGPDVYWVNTPMIASWLKDGVMENLTSKIASAHVNLSQYLPALVSLHTFSGQMYGMPKDWDTIAYFYNATYFADHHITIPSSLTWNPANGGTWLTFLKEITYDTSGHNALSADFNPNSVATYGTDSPNEMQWGFEPYLAENGVKLISQPYAKTVSFGSPAGVQTFQFLTNLMYKYHVAVPGSDLGTDAAANDSEDQTLFAQGKVATIEGGDWEIAGIKQEVKFKLGVLPAPCGPDGCWTVLNGLIDSVNAHSPNQQAAWELEQWLGSAQSEQILGSGGYIWPGIGSLDSQFASYWQSQGLDVTPFESESKWNVVYWPVTPGMGQAQLDIANQLAPAYLSGRNVGQAVSAAASQANDDLASAG
ncbi:MAG TPA: sugar ABC transporter substrate-binding protein [Trebonia sp.]|nr:sugar ABC transporter substrate-binding protein [Trebonia sp.]